MSFAENRMFLRDDLNCGGHGDVEHRLFFRESLIAKVGYEIGSNLPGVWG